MNKLKFILIISILINFSIISHSCAYQQTQSINHTPPSLQFINFKYKDPINNISVHGTFLPYREFYIPEHGQTVIPFNGKYNGTAEITLTRLSDMRSITKEFRNVLFVSTDHCLNFSEYNYQNPSNECLLEDPLILEPRDYKHDVSGFLPNVGLKIVDYDYDNKNELILSQPVDGRGGADLDIYEIIDTKEDFLISSDSFGYIPGTVEFDVDNKTMNYSYSSGACLSDFYYFKAEGLDGYKLYKRINIDMTEVDGQYFCKKTVYLE
jgi:hypothetical protein